MLASLVLLLAVAAGAQPAPPGADVDPSIADGSAQYKLDDARQTWRRNGPKSYRYRLQLYTFCTTDTLNPRTFVVRKGKPVHPPKGWKSRATVPRLFKLVQKAIDQRVDGLQVEYRPNGALKLLQVDQQSMAVDDEYSYSLDRFKRLR
jgi:hypothetical protein